MRTYLLAILLASTVASAAPDPKPVTPDELATLAAKTKPGQEVEVRPGMFITFHRMQATSPIGHGWQRAKSTDGAFTVDMPAKFNDFMMRTAATDGTEVRVDVVGGTTGTLKWAASCVRRKDGTHGPNKFESKTESMGTPVRAWMRTLELGPRLCSITVETTGADPLPSDADLKRFLESIKATGKPRW